MVRNTAFARDFLMRWANYYDHRPSGFSSSDNGAIQLVAPLVPPAFSCCSLSCFTPDVLRKVVCWAKVMETLRVEGYETCFDMYKNLTSQAPPCATLMRQAPDEAPESRQVTDLQPYWDYVHCTKEAPA